MENRWKYTDPKAMPVPLKKLGDIVYTSCPWDGSDYDYMCWMYDWWDDGSGSILFIHESLSTEFEEWAKAYNK